MLHFRQRATLLGIVGAMAIVAAYFGEVVFGGNVYYSGDIARIYLPQRVALSRALAARSVLWWSTEIGSGYPILAEGEMGALYPLNWLLYCLFPPELGLNASIVLHYVIAGAGFYLYARSTKLSPGAAYLGGIIWTLGGFSIAHLSHVSILTVAAWLPWMFLCTHRLLSANGTAERFPRLARALELALVVGLQFLAGHPQMSFLGLVPLLAYTLTIAWSSGLSRSLPRLAHWLGAMALGTLLGAPQLLPALELGAISQRAGGLESPFFTSYSFHPLLLATYVSPFVLGNPYPKGSVELMGYVGLLPLVLAQVALWRSPRRGKWFFAVLVLLGVLLAFGRWNPWYTRLRQVPLLNLFRVPARYLYWVSFGLAVLSAIGLDALRALTTDRVTRAGWVLLGLSVLCLGVTLMSVWSSGIADLVAAWRWLPLGFLVATVAVVLAARHTSAMVCTIAACVTLCIDLYAYGAVLDSTYNDTMPRDRVIRRPDSLSFLEQDSSLWRLYVKEEIVPALSVMRESFYPNMGMTHGLPSANIYLPLVPSAYNDYLDTLTPQRLNRLNVKYYLIPQLLPVDAHSELYDVHNPFASIPSGTWLEFPPVNVTGLSVESYLSHSANLRDGEVVAVLHLRGASGQEATVPLRAGLETAEWAYERDDVLANVAHSMPSVATTWFSQSGFPPREHPGHTYLARIPLDATMRLAAVKLQPVVPEAFVRVERVRLHDVSGQAQLLTHLIGLGDHSIVYRSEDVLIYRNEDVLPRSYSVSASSVTVMDSSLALPQVLRLNDARSVTVTQYGDTEVMLRASVAEPSYLILADLAYPGWRATVDGVAAPILLADGVFRALALGAGEHEIRFVYKPSFALYFERG